MALARWLEPHPNVEVVIYPGLASHPQHLLAASLFENGYGGMVAFTVPGGVEETQVVLDHMEMAYDAVSLGDLDTLIEHPATMTHGKIPPEERVKMGLPDNLIRVSVGVEDIDDIIADFDQALRCL